MYISLNSVGITTDEINARFRGNADFHMIDVDELFENVAYEDEMVSRLRTRVNAFARILGVPADYVYLDEVSHEGHDITPSGDAEERVDQAAKLYYWLANDTLGDWDYLPMFAKLYTDGWKYVDFDDLRREAEDFFMQYDEDDEAQLAQHMVDEGLLEGPGDEWEWYIDWEAKGKDIASEYQSYDYEGTTYLFHN